jgi:hypothetical protein
MAAAGKEWKKLDPARQQAYKDIAKAGQVALAHHGSQSARPRPQHIADLEVLSEDLGVNPQRPHRLLSS